jgi:hypothetical protein
MDDMFFGKDEISVHIFNNPCKKSKRITELRKIGDTKNQYVTNIYYLDTLYGDDEIYSDIRDCGDGPVYSYYHGECEYCQEHVKKTKENLIVGFKIYPKGMIPEQTYKQRAIGWKKYKFLNI